jgi:hypothetical protein
VILSWIELYFSLPVSRNPLIECISALIRQYLIENFKYCLWPTVEGWSFPEYWGNCFQKTSSHQRKKAWQLCLDVVCTTHSFPTWKHINLLIIMFFSIFMTVNGMQTPKTLKWLSRHSYYVISKPNWIKQCTITDCARNICHICYHFLLFETFMWSWPYQWQFYLWNSEYLLELQLFSVYHKYVGILYFIFRIYVQVFHSQIRLRLVGFYSFIRFL